MPTSARIWNNKVEIGQRYIEVDSGRVYEVVRLEFVVQISIVNRKMMKWANVGRISGDTNKQWNYGFLRPKTKVHRVTRKIVLVKTPAPSSSSGILFYPDAIEIIDLNNYDIPVLGKDLGKESWIFRQRFNVLDNLGRLRVGWKSKLVIEK